MVSEFWNSFSGSLTQSDPTYTQVANYLGISTGFLLVVVVIISIWSLIWKGFALWKSAKKSHKIWFIVILIANTIGILEILYIYVFSKLGEKKQKKAK